MASAPQPHPEWCREPHRLLFPLGAALGVVAVLPFSCGGAAGGALAPFHSAAQIQGFLTCFVAGFLLTLVPRETRTAPAARWEVGAALALPPVAVLCAWMGDVALAGWLWLVLLATVLAFTVSRLRASPPALQLGSILVWVPASLAAAAVGAVLVSTGAPLAMPGALDAWTVGRGLVVQGFVTGLVLGTSGLLLPLVTRGEEPAPGRARRSGVVLHSAAALAFFGSFPLELAIGPRLGFALRAAVALGVLLGSARIHRRPVLPGLNRWLVWLAAWLVPAAFLLGAAGLRFRGAALHVLFVGGFAQLTLAASTLSLRREPAAAAPRPLALGAMAVLLAAAFGARIAATLDGRHVAGWLAVAACAFAAAVLAWGATVARRLAGGRSPRARGARRTAAPAAPGPHAGGGGSRRLALPAAGVHLEVRVRS
jgi:uncharacterized protein involved in response to NO